ncbi:hypothetical protein BMF94_7041 [Rhodotorula taiwanensis]|uniref:methionyl-tRNA formyltransferase n=1 Tax=Rhodotorula taiwanensis TaxID=741276 RepID=A0A2S5AZI9_9BASI|nr:hypothetical protein BMF94_7041 [Rhodotorula taiwanensis]
MLHQRLTSLRPRLRFRWPLPSPARWLSSADSPYRVLFFGADDFSCGVFRELYKERQDLIDSVTVVTPPDQRVGRRNRELHRPRLRLLAEELGVEAVALPPTGLKGWQPPDPFLQPSPRNLLLTASFGHMIPSTLLSLFDSTCALNVHPSLLPRWRGAAPLQWSILSGDVEAGRSGVTVQELSAGRFDRGRLLGSEGVPDLPPDADYHDLERRLSTVGGRLLVSVLRGGSTPLDQCKEGVTLARKLGRHDVSVDFSAMTALEAVRLQRAIGHQHPLWTRFSGSVLQMEVAPTSASLDTGSLSLVDGCLVIGCRSGAVQLIRVKREGGKWVDACAWWNGTGRVPGFAFA